MAVHKTCCICHESFVPHPRVKNRQKTCASEVCRKELKKRTNRAWREQNPDYFKGRYETELKEWHRKNGDYKRRYRQENPEYMQKNKEYVRVYRRRRYNHRDQSLSD